MLLINQIKNDLVKKVTFGESITYIPFLKLYEPYQKWLPEGVFATEVMNINPANFHSLKFGGTIVIAPFFEFDAQTVEMILLEMKQRFQESDIDYETFREIYKDYEHLVKEQDFAKIIFNINNSFFAKFKNGLHRARIFKNEENAFITYYAKLYDLLYPYYKGQKIDYEGFLKLHQKYAPCLSESDFAVCLGLNYGTYLSIKKRKKRDGRGSETILFSNSKIDYSRIDISTLQQMYRNKKINYYGFQEIYFKYGNGLKEDEFARLLGIPFNTFDNFRRKKTLNLIILKKSLSKEEQLAILAECRQKGLTRRTINYEEFLEYYKPYQEYVSLTDFAYIIGIKQRSIYKLKTGSNILALDFDFNSQIAGMIKQELMKYHYTYVSYREFLELFSKYNNYVSETEFAYLLGISLTEYYKIKNHEEEKAPIDFYKIERRIIKHYLKESKMYTWEDFEVLSKMIELDIERILLLYFGEDKIDIARKYFNALISNRQLFLGSAPLLDTSLADDIFAFCQNYAKAVCLNLGCPKLTEDIAAEAMAHVLENCDSFKINFGDEWWNFYKPYLVGIMKVWCKRQKSKVPVASLDAPVDNSKKVRTRYDFIASPGNDYAELANSFDENDDIYSQVISAINYGMDINEIIGAIAQKLGVNPEDVSEMLKEQMINQKLVKENDDGSILLAHQS